VSLTIERVVQSGAATVRPILFHDGCGEWRTFVGGGAGAFGSVGTFTLGGPGQGVAVGQTATLRLGSTLPAPRPWRVLATLELRLRDADGVAWALRWDESGDTFTVTDTRVPALFALAGPRTQDSGPTGQSVTLTLPLQVLTGAAGRTFRLEVRATDDTGAVQGFESAGELTVLAAASAPAPPPSGPAVESAPPVKEEPEESRRLTEQERWQQSRTNAGSREDERIEGDVLAVDCTARPPTITIGNRDGEVTVELRGEAAGDCGRIRPGQYLEADGEKVHEQRFLADRISAE
jgi:YD repeat-containing protein